MTFDPSQLSDEELAAISPAEFMGIVKSMSDKDLKALMASDQRSRILDAVFARMPDLYRGKEGAKRSVTHWTITGAKGAPDDAYTVVFDGLECSQTKGFEGEPRSSLTMGPSEFAKIITKSGNPVTMVMLGKVKLKGDIGYAAKIADFFELPA